MLAVPLSRVSSCGFVGLVCGAVVVGVGVSPSWASGREGGSGSPVVGGFGLGDGVEGLVDERSGGFSFDLPVTGGVGVGWDSRRAGVDRFGLGEGWALSGVGFVEPVGGLRVFPSSGGVFAADAAEPSGWLGTRWMMWCSPMRRVCCRRVRMGWWVSGRMRTAVGVGWRRSRTSTRRVIRWRGWMGSGIGRIGCGTRRPGTGWPGWSTRSG